MYAYRYSWIVKPSDCMFFKDSILSLEVEKFKVTKHTLKGVWIDCYGKPKFILTSAKKKYANLNKEGAFNDFIRRKQIQLSILKNQVANLEQLFEALKHGRIKQ